MIKEIQQNVNLYLKLLGYTEFDTVFFRAFSDKKQARKESYPVSKINYNTLQELNTKGLGIHLVVNGGGQTDAEVKHCLAIFYEHDNLPKDEQKQLSLAKT